MNANANAQLTNGTVRANYKFTNTTNAYATLTLEGVQAYHDATLHTFAETFDGTVYAIDTNADGVHIIDAKLTHTTRGDKYELVVTTVNCGIIHITTNTTAAIDYRKVARKFMDTCDKRRAKREAANTPDAIAKREAAKRTSDARRKANAYRKTLIKHGMDESRAIDEAQRFYNQLIGC